MITENFIYAPRKHSLYFIEMGKRSKESTSGVIKRKVFLEGVDSSVFRVGVYLNTESEVFNRHFKPTSLTLKEVKINLLKNIWYYENIRRKNLVLLGDRLLKTRRFYFYKKQSS